MIATSRLLGHPTSAAAETGSRSPLMPRAIRWSIGLAIGALLVFAPGPASADEGLLGELTGGVGEIVEPVAQPVTEPLVEPAVEPLAEPVTDLVGPAAEPVIEPLAEPVVERLSEATQPVIEPLGEPVVELTAPVTEAGEPVTQLLERVVEPVSGLVDLVEPVIEPIDAVAQPVTGLVEPIVRPVWELVEPAFDPVTSTVEPVLEPVTRLVEPVQRLTRPVSTVPEPVSIVVEPVLGGAPTLVVGERPARWGSPPPAFDSLVPESGPMTRPGSAGAAPLAPPDGSVWTKPPEAIEAGPSVAVASSATSPWWTGLGPVGALGSSSSSQALSGVSIGLSIALGLSLLYLVPPPSMVRRLHLAAVFWQPQRFVGPLERPG